MRVWVKYLAIFFIIPACDSKGLEDDTGANNNTAANDDDTAANDGDTAVDDDDTGGNCNSPLMSDDLDSVMTVATSFWTDPDSSGTDGDITYCGEGEESDWTWCEGHEGDLHPLGVAAGGEITLYRGDHADMFGSDSVAVNVCSPVIDASNCGSTTLEFQHSLSLQAAATTRLAIVEPNNCFSGWSMFGQDFDASQLISTFSMDTTSGTALEDYSVSITDHLPDSGQFRIVWQLELPNNAASYPTWTFDNVVVTGTD